MKRCFVSFLLIFFSLTVFAQKEYVVYDCAPDAKVFRVDTKTWAPLVKGETLNENDLILVKKKGMVKILDNGTRRIYSNVKTGKQPVSLLIKASAKSANSSFGNLNRQLAKNVKNSDHREKYYSTYGATMRGYNDDITFADSIFYAVFQGIKSLRPSELIQLKESIDSDGTVSFSIVNDSDDLYYATVVYGNKSRLEPCFDADIQGTDVIPIEPHSTANLQSFGFSPASGDCLYYLLASKREFWMEPLKPAIRYMVQPDFDADPDLLLVIPVS